MYCINCGKKVPSDAKYCPECGGNVSAVSAQDKKEKGGKPRMSLKTWILYTVAIFIFTIIGIIVIQAFNISDENKSQITGIFIIIIVFFIILFLISLVIGKIFKPRNAKAKLIYLGGAFVVLFLIFFIGITWGNRVLYQNEANEALPQIQDALAEAASAKILGDSIVEKNPIFGASMMRVEAISQMAIDRINLLSKTNSIPPALVDYRDSVLAWIKDISAAAKDNKKWKNLSVRPRDFELKVSDSQAQKYLKTSIDKITELQEFADTAIAKNNPDAMRYIAAKLLSQEHWLLGIVYSGKPGLFSLNLTNRVLALDIKGPDMGGPLRPSIFTQGKTIRSVCLTEQPAGVASFYCAENVIGAADNLRAAATDFAKGKSGAKTNWSNAQKNNKDNLPPSPVADKSGNSPTVQSFLDACKAKGGTVGGEAIMSNLPTTDGGYVCNYKKDNENCWDYLAYSSGQYSGGDTGCSGKNISAPAPETDIKGKWDGDYYMKGSMKCSGDIPNFPSTISLNKPFTVKNNQVIAGGKVIGTINDAGIISSAMVQSSVVPNSQGDSFTMNTIDISYGYFYMDGNNIKFKGEESGVAKLILYAPWNKSFNESCDGDFSGSTVAEEQSSAPVAPAPAPVQNPTSVPEIPSSGPVSPVRQRPSEVVPTPPETQTQQSTTQPSTQNFPCSSNADCNTYSANHCGTGGALCASDGTCHCNLLDQGFWVKCPCPSGYVCIGRYCGAASGGWRNE